MQSEKFDSKVKQAAEQHHPDYDSKAWTKMEKLLDRHLPQKDDRRRRVIFFVLLFLLLGGGAWLITSKPWQPADQTLTTTTAPAKTDTRPSPVSTEPARVENSNLERDKKESSVPPVIAIDKQENQPAGVEKEPRQTSTSLTGKTKSQSTKTEWDAPTANNTTKLTGANNVTNELPGPFKTQKETKATDENKIISSPATTNTTAGKQSGTDKNKTTTDQPVKNGQVNDDGAETIKDKSTEEVKSNDQKTAAKKTSSKKRNTFFFSLGAATDISWIALDNPGKVKLLTGAGFGYTIKDRFTIRTGFYGGRKIYSATKDDYKPEVSPINPQFIDNIAADCKIYEIPLNFSYNFNHAKNHFLFAGAGLSSYLMKKENYVYNYKYPNGTSYSYTKHVNNEYKHFFSVLTLSAGYQRKINKTFSISAEPYVKLPLGGVGYGRVKLASGGIMLSLNATPFQSSAKK